MNCKFCDAEMGMDAKFCPNCGKPVNEPEQVVTPVEETAVQEPAQGPEIVENKKNTGRIALIIVAVVVALAVLVAVIVGGLGNTSDTDPTDSAVEATEGTIPPDGNPDDATCKGSYTADDETMAAAGDTVVATMGGRELTVRQLQVYYWTEFVYFMQEYGSYVSYFGLDYTQPLDTQVCAVGETTMTWQQYFLACALDTWKSYQAMTLEAEANGLELSEEALAELDKLPGLMAESAAEYGLADANELIRTNFGSSVTVDDYVKYWELYYSGYEYYNDQAEKLEPTAEEVEVYFTENEAVYTENGVTKDGKYVDVRHILVMPEGGTTDEETGETTYSEEEWEACRVKAQELLDQWLAGEATEDAFAALATEHSEDGGSVSTGGLYEDVYVGQMVEPFENWCFDEVRQVGDYGLVQTEYGYHIMYFVGSTDIWFATAESDLYNERLSAIVPAMMEKYPAEIDYSAILLGQVDLG